MHFQTSHETVSVREGGGLLLPLGSQSPKEKAKYWVSSCSRGGQREHRRITGGLRVGPVLKVRPLKMALPVACRGPPGKGRWHEQHPTLTLQASR